MKGPDITFDNNVIHAVLTCLYKTVRSYTGGKKIRILDQNIWETHEFQQWWKTMGPERRTTNIHDNRVSDNVGYWWYMDLFCIIASLYDIPIYSTLTTSSCHELSDTEFSFSILHIHATRWWQIYHTCQLKNCKSNSTNVINASLLFLNSSQASGKERQFNWIMRHMNIGHVFLVSA